MKELQAREPQSEIQTRQEEDRIKARVVVSGEGVDGTRYGPWTKWFSAPSQPDFLASQAYLEMFIQGKWSKDADFERAG